MYKLTKCEQNISGGNKMKKILVCLLSLFILTGCMGNKNDTALEDTPNNDASNNQSISNNSQSTKEDWYKNFENELAGKDFKYSSANALNAGSEFTILFLSTQ